MKFQSAHPDIQHAALPRSGNSLVFVVGWLWIGWPLAWLYSLTTVVSATESASTMLDLVTRWMWCHKVETCFLQIPVQLRCVGWHEPRTTNKLAHLKICRCGCWEPISLRESGSCDSSIVPPGGKADRLSIAAWLSGCWSKWWLSQYIFRMICCFRKAYASLSVVSILRKGHQNPGHVITWQPHGGRNAG